MTLVSPGPPVSAAAEANLDRATSEFGAAVGEFNRLQGEMDATVAFNQDLLDRQNGIHGLEEAADDGVANQGWRRDGAAASGSSGSMSKARRTRRPVRVERATDSMRTQAIARPNTASRMGIRMRMARSSGRARAGRSGAKVPAGRGVSLRIRRKSRATLDRKVRDPGPRRKLKKCRARRGVRPAGSAVERCCSRLRQSRAPGPVPTVTAIAPAV